MLRLLTHALHWSIALVGVTGAAYALPGRVSSDRLTDLRAEVAPAASPPQ